MPQEIATDLIRTDEGALKVGTAETVCISEDEVEKVDLYETFANVNEIPAQLYKDHDVKRGLRNADGSGVLAGITNISNVHGYRMEDGVKVPDEGSLSLRGYDLYDLLGDPSPSHRYRFEELTYLLLMGELPTADDLARFVSVIDAHRELPDGFTASMLMRDAAPSIMNVLSRSVLQLYAYDDHAEERTPKHEIHTALSLISRLPRIMVLSYYSKRARFFHESMIMHRFQEGETTAETILSMLRPDRGYTPEEAAMLDVMLCLHAEHGGGNNSTFTMRVLSSADTDAYSAYAAAIGSLKGYRHGGANHKVRAMQNDLKENIPLERWDDEGAVGDYLRRVVRKEAYDKTGLVYGMGHAVYTLSDPRAVVCKRAGIPAAPDHRAHRSPDRGRGTGRLQGALRQCGYVFRLRLFHDGRPGRPLYAAVRLRPHGGLGGSSLRGDRLGQAHHPSGLQEHQDRHRKLSADR